MWTQVITGVIQTSLDPETKTGRIKAGLLAKVTKGNNYQQRWATVDSQSLKFFASEEESSTLKDVESSIAIRDISEVVPVGPPRLAPPLSPGPDMPAVPCRPRAALPIAPR